MSNEINLQNEIINLKNKIKELEKIIEDLKWQSYDYKWQEIYNYFDKNGIKKTSVKFDMSIIDVIDFITKCDDNTFGIVNAFDYVECYKEVYGKEPFSDDDE